MVILLFRNFICIYLAPRALAWAINTLVYIRSLRYLAQGLALGLSYYICSILSCGTLRTQHLDTLHCRYPGR